LTYEVGVAAQFEAAHQLGGDFGPAARLHGHTYRLEVSLRCAELQPDGTAYDLARQVLGYEPTIGLADGLRRTWEWFRDEVFAPAEVS